MNSNSTFKSIPGYSRYVIDSNGNAIIVDTGDIVKWHHSNGYLFSRLVDDLGNRSSVGQHRAIALAFLPMPDCSTRVIVNHKDGIKNHNVLDNLEWSTYSDNVNHAYRTSLRTDLVPVIATHEPTGKILKFYSKGECCRYFGWNRDVLSSPKKAYPRHLTIEDYNLEFLIEESTWSNVCEYPTGVAAKNIQTKQVIVADTPGELGKLLDVCPKLIKRILQGSKFQYPTKGYDFRVFSADVEWPDYTVEELEAFKDIEFIYQPVTVSFPNGEKLLVGSVLAASKISGTPERSVRFYLKDGQACKNGYRYEKYDRVVVVNA